MTQRLCTLLSLTQLSQYNHRVLRRERKGTEPVRNWRAEAEAGHEEHDKLTHLTTVNFEDRKSSLGHGIFMTSRI